MTKFGRLWFGTKDFDLRSEIWEHTFSIPEVSLVEGHVEVEHPAAVEDDVPDARGRGAALQFAELHFLDEQRTEKTIPNSN